MGLHKISWEGLARGIDPFTTPKTATESIIATISGVIQGSSLRFLFSSKRSKGLVLFNGFA